MSCSSSERFGCFSPRCQSCSVLSQCYTSSKESNVSRKDQAYGDNDEARGDHEEKPLQLVKVHATDNPADLLMKGLTCEWFKHCRQLMDIGRDVFSTYCTYVRSILLLRDTFPFKWEIVGPKGRMSRHPPGESQIQVFFSSFIRIIIHTLVRRPRHSTCSLCVSCASASCQENV